MCVCEGESVCESVFVSVFVCVRILLIDLLHNFDLNKGLKIFKINRVNR